MLDRIQKFVMGMNQYSAEPLLHMKVVFKNESKHCREAFTKADQLTVCGH